MSTTSFPSQTFDETGCDYFLFHTPGKKDHVTIDIYYSLEHHNGIHTEEVDLLDVKESNEFPSWYPLFQLPFQIDVKVTCTGVHVYIEIIYIDSSPVTEVWHMAHFWVSYGRCTMPGSPMGRSEGSSRRWTG